MADVLFAIRGNSRYNDKIGIVSFGMYRRKGVIQSSMKDTRGIIAVCGCQLFEEKEYAFISELSRQCEGGDYMVAAFNFAANSMADMDEIGKEMRLVQLMEKTECAAVIILGETINDDTMRETIGRNMVKKGVPVFSLERKMEGCIHVAMDYGSGFKNMVLHVLKEHHVKRPAMLAGIKGNHFSDTRIQAFREALEECGVPFDEELLKYGDFWEIPASVAAKQYLAMDKLPDAIICANDTMAITASRCIIEAGLRVPEDIIVTGFDGIISGRLNFPAISSVAPDYESECKAILDVVKAHHNGESYSTEDRLIEFKVIPNLSCGCPPPDENTAERMANDMANAMIDQKWNVHAMNRLLFEATAKDELVTATDILVRAVNMWNNYYHFVGVYTDYLEGEPEGEPGTRCVSVLSLKDGEYGRIGIFYDESELVPNLDEVKQRDNGINVLMIRLLFARSEVYGYLIEGFNKPTERDMRRCGELDMFVSTGFNVILKNRKLTWLNAQLKDANEVMEKASTQDYLTKIYNRRGFYEALNDLIQNEANRGRVLTIFSIDMDKLKYINDNFGHLEGDYAICAMADAVKNFASKNGICARFGGDEFACAMISVGEMNIEAEEVRRQLVDYIGTHTRPKRYKIAASVGSCGEIISMEIDIDRMMSEADRKMYIDKEARRMARE